MVHRSGPIGPPDRVPGLRQVRRYRNPHPGVVRRERTAPTEIPGLNGQNTFSFSPTTGAKECACKRLRGSIPRQATGGVWSVTGSVSEGDGWPATDPHLHPPLNSKRNLAAQHTPRGQNPYSIRKGHHERYHRRTRMKLLKALFRRGRHHRLRVSTFTMTWR